MKIQVDIPSHINKALKIERIQEGISNMQELIVMILKERYEVEESG